MTKKTKQKKNHTCIQVHKYLNTDAIFASVHLHNGFQIQQSRCDWNPSMGFNSSGITKSALYSKIQT